MELHSILAEVLFCIKGGKNMFERTLTKHLDHIVKHFPVLFLTGPRQVGKSTLLENYCTKKYNMVSLDNLDERKKAQQDPALFLQDHEPPLFIDEVQYAPQLFPYIKIYVDKHKNKNGLFLLTGSQKFSMIKNIQESLAGRVAIVDMLGFSNQEINRNPNYDFFLPTEIWLKKLRSKKIKSLTNLELFTKIWLGSFPALINNKGAERELYYNSYIRTYIERDIRDIFKISDIITFQNFIKATAARTGQLLNYADLAKDMAVDVKTVKNWLSILEFGGLVYLLPPYYNNVTKRIIKTPKLYFLDTGLCAYLTGWDNPKSLEAGAMNGAILETYVFTELLKSYWHNAKEPNIYFYRDRDGKEIDFLLEMNNTLYPIEVKKTMLPDKTMIKNFSVLNNLKKEIGKGVLLSLKPEVSYITETTLSVPIWSI